MGRTEFEILIFIVLATLILLVFIGGIIFFIVQYHKRKLVYEKEKAILNEQYIQDLLNTKLEIQQQTMEDIGREIHDNIGQHLTLASIHANKLAFEQQYPLIRDQVLSISTILNESLAGLRSLSRNLTNSVSEFKELRALVEKECKRINGMDICNIETHFADADFKMSATIKIFILRIMQEFLQNSLKHANCKNIILDFVFDDKGLKVTAKDDGKGFDIAGYRENEKRGIGLGNMKKRADLIGAEFEMKSVVNEGTSIYLFIPVQKLIDS